MSRYAAYCLSLPIMAAFAGHAFAQDPTTAYVGETIIDGTGAAPIRSGVIVVSGNRIVSVGAKGQVAIPAGSKIVDESGKYILPGYIDTNSHISLYGGLPLQRYETSVKYWSRRNEVTVTGAQEMLKYGITTLLDSYGSLPQLLAARDKINSGKVIGPRIYAAGNIFGWGGPFSQTFGGVSSHGLTRFQQELNEDIMQGAGEDLASLSPEQVAARMESYIAKGPTFIKYGGTSHTSDMLEFSPNAQKAMITVAHAHGLMVQTHSTSPEAMRIAVGAGVDVIQHPEVPSSQVFQEVPDDIVKAMVDHHVICSMQPNSATGRTWQLYIAAKDPKTGIAPESADYPPYIETMRINDIKYIKAGCTISIGSDNFGGASLEFRRPSGESEGVSMHWRKLGDSTILGAEGLVELGMTPMNAIISLTKNGALAAHNPDIGTLAAGKMADMVILNANPLDNIHNLRAINVIVVGGKPVSPGTLPVDPVFPTQ